jgi:glycosyltransferase involved in cell wall biosynthesis
VPKVLYVGSNHPRNRPGGAEIYAHELYRTIRLDDAFEAVFVAKVGPPVSVDLKPDGSRFSLAGADPNDYYLHTETDEFDRLIWTARDKRLYTRDWRAFLRAQAPDIVHFQHSLFLGYDMIRETRRTLPHAVIVYTLHEFIPICHHQGQMVRTETLQPCQAASPRRCHQCFPEISTEAFFLRERFIKAAFDLVDMFIVPSEHARERYIDWGIPAEKIEHHDYGRIPVASAPDPPDAGRRNRIGFFGQITRYKGVDVLLEAMQILAGRDTPVALLLRGANLERTPLAFQERIHTLLAETAGNVRFLGRYEQADLPHLLAAVDWVIVPSIWWETGPLVIHEALMHHRPVICSDIGAMLERITDGVNGLHFRTGDPHNLADTIEHALTTPGLWQALRDQITPPHPMNAHLTTLTSLYHTLLSRAAQPG